MDGRSQNGEPVVQTKKTPNLSLRGSVEKARSTRSSISYKPKGDRENLLKTIMM